MARFILIDHSIVGLVGHHYESAMHVLQAAEQVGYEPILATNRGFKPDGNLGYQEATLDLLKSHLCSHMIFEIDEPKEIWCQLLRKSEGVFSFNWIEIRKICFPTDNSSHAIQRRDVRWLRHLFTQVEKLCNLKYYLKQ